MSARRLALIALLAANAGLFAWHARDAFGWREAFAQGNGSRQELARRLAEAEKALAAVTAQLASQRQAMLNTQSALVSAVPACNSTPPEEAAPTPEQLRSASQGDAIVDAALARASWRDEDSLALNALDNLRDADRNRLLQRVVVAINADQLRVELINQPF